MTARILRRQTRRLLSWRAAMACIALLAVACSDGDGIQQAAEGSRDPTDAEAVRYGAAGYGQGYTEEEIGVGLLVDEYFADNHILARYRTYEDYHEASVAEGHFRSLSVEARDRVFFEQAVSLLFLATDEAAPAEVSAAADELWHAFYKSLDMCVERSEWSEAKLYSVRSDGYLSATYDEFQSDIQQHAMTLDEFLDFRHECHKFAATYPALDRERRDDLLAIRRDHYLEILRLWMQANPELVVPMTYEQSVNHPYQDYVRDICEAADDPQECIRLEGVGLP